MNTATRSLETHELEGDDALNALHRTGRGRLAKDSFQRFRTGTVGLSDHPVRLPPLHWSDHVRRAGPLRPFWIAEGWRRPP
jgi:hypothetical protein